MVSFKQDLDLVLNRICSNFTSNSRSSMLVNSSLGKDRYRSGHNIGVTRFYFLLRTSFSGSDIGTAVSGSGLLLVWIFLGARVYISHSVVQLVSE